MYPIFSSEIMARSAPNMLSYFEHVYNNTLEYWNCHDFAGKISVGKIEADGELDSLTGGILGILEKHKKAR